MKTVVQTNLLDRVAYAISPSWGLNRLRHRATTAMLFDGVGHSGFIVPGSAKRSMRGWPVTANHVDRDVIPVLEGSRAGARDLFMNTPIATGALRRVKTNVVGWGLTLQSRVDRQYLGLTDEQADAWERNVEREWKVWSQSPECDTRRTLNFQSLQGLALFSVLLSGDVFVLLPYVKRKGVSYDLRVQIVEADFVSNPYNKMETSSLSGGVETDTWGAPVAYYMRRIPADFPVLSQSTGFMDWLGTWERVEAFGAKSGRKNVLHLMHVERPGQRRGVSFLAPVIEKLKNLSRLSDSELTAAVVTSFYTVFVKSSLPGANGLGESFMKSEKVTNPDAVATDKNLYEMGPANIIELSDGESIEMADPKRPNAAFAPFFEAIVKEIGAALEIPAEQILLTFNASYSASRAALLEAWKMYKNMRHWLSDYFCQPVYAEWLTEAIMKGRISAPGFFESAATKAAWCGSAWTGPGQGQINPAVETDAALARIGGRLSTYEQEYTALHGNDFEGAAHRMAREQKLLKDLKIEPVDLQPESTKAKAEVESTSTSTTVDESKPASAKPPGDDDGEA